MLNRYVTHIKTKTPHDRRQHAMQVSAGIVAVVFVIWISTLGLRLATAPQTASSDANQLANIVSGSGTQNSTLIVASSSDSQSY